MNKQEQIEKMSKKICKSTSVGCNSPTCMKCGIKDTCKARIYATRAFETGYINGADFVVWLKSRKISSKDYPHLEVALCFDDTREELMNFIDEALQEYLKGE